MENDKRNLGAAFTCQDCSETWSVKNALDTVLKLGMIAGMGYLIYINRETVRDLSKKVLNKANSSLNGSNKTSVAKEPKKSKQIRN